MRQLCQGGNNGPPESVNCAGKISIMPHVASEMAGTVGGGCEGRTYISHTLRDMAVSSPQAVGETGGLSSSPLNNSGVRGDAEYKQSNSMETTSEGTLTSMDAINIATSEDNYESGNESVSSDTSYSAGIHTSGDDTDEECVSVQEVDRSMKTLRTRVAKPWEEVWGLL